MLKTWQSTLNSIKKIGQLTWDYIKLAGLKAVQAVLNGFSKIPIIGKYFKSASEQVGKWIGAIQGDIKGLRGQTVKIGANFVATSAWSKPMGSLATGGPVKGPGTETSDSIFAGNAWVSNGEWVMNAKARKKYGDGFMSAVNAGRYAGGGPVDIKAKTDLKPSTDSIFNAIKKTILAGASVWAKMFGGGGEAIVNFARSFVGKVPYVWGGTTTRGWDCSGFTDYVYNHFGYSPPRVASAQQDWAQRSGNVPGALVFFGNPAHHVGISTGGNQMINAYGTGYGTIISSLLGNAGFGIPPGGFRTGGSGISYGKGSAVGLGRMMAATYGWTGSQFDALYKLWMRESGWNQNAQNPSSGAAGIPQDITGNFHGGAAGQIAWGLNYILHRYGSPIAAWNHELATGWYSKGGPVSQYANGVNGAKKGWAWVGERGKELVHFAGGEQVLSHEDSMSSDVDDGYAKGTKKKKKSPSLADRIAAADREMRRLKYAPIAKHIDDLNKWLNTIHAAIATDNATLRIKHLSKAMHNKVMHDITKQKNLLTYVGKEATHYRDERNVVTGVEGLIQGRINSLNVQIAAAKKWHLKAKAASMTKTVNSYKAEIAKINKWLGVVKKKVVKPLTPAQQAKLDAAANPAVANIGPSDLETTLTVLGNYMSHIAQFPGYTASSASMWKAFGFAKGGVINEPIFGVGRSGQAYTFGEHGKETVTPGTGGGNTYNITVNVTPMSSPRDVGGAIVKAIKAYEHGTGSGWRS
jgi:cell wall-associated NlpC family hydrolase